MDTRYDDLPMVNLDVSYTGSDRTRICAFYREYKNGVSCFDSVDSQIERLNRMLQAQNKYLGNHEAVMMDDMNVCYKGMNDSDYNNKRTVQVIADYMLEETIEQVNENDKRV